MCPLPSWERALTDSPSVMMGEGDSPLTHSFHLICCGCPLPQGERAQRRTPRTLRPRLIPRSPAKRQLQRPLQWGRHPVSRNCCGVKRSALNFKIETWVRGDCMHITKLIASCCLALCLGGCISTQEMPLAPNVVRIDTQSRGYLFTEQTVPTTMRAAAKATLERGYSHFKFAEASLQQGSVVAGAVSSANANYNGTYGNGFYSGQASGFGTTSVVHAPTAGAAVTVIMFHATEPGAQGAFDAEQVLKQYSQ